jgi:hypothetical protein
VLADAPFAGIGVFVTPAEAGAAALLKYRPGFALNFSTQPALQK